MRDTFFPSLGQTFLDSDLGAGFCEVTEGLQCIPHPSARFTQNGLFKSRTADAHGHCGCTTSNKRGALCDVQCDLIGLSVRLARFLGRVVRIGIGTRRCTTSRFGDVRQDTGGHASGGAHLRGNSLTVLEREGYTLSPGCGDAANQQRSNFLDTFHADIFGQELQRGRLERAIDGFQRTANTLGVANDVLHVLDCGLVLRSVICLAKVLKRSRKLAQRGVARSVPSQHGDTVDGFQEPATRLDDVSRSIDQRGVARFFGPAHQSLSAVEHSLAHDTRPRGRVGAVCQQLVSFRWARRSDHDCGWRGCVVASGSVPVLRCSIGVGCNPHGDTVVAVLQCRAAVVELLLRSQPQASRHRELVRRWGRPLPVRVPGDLNTQHTVLLIFDQLVKRCGVTRKDVLRRRTAKRGDVVAVRSVDVVQNLGNLRRVCGRDIHAFGSQCFVHQTGTLRTEFGFGGFGVRRCVFKLPHAKVVVIDVDICTQPVEFAVLISVKAGAHCLDKRTVRSKEQRVELFSERIRLGGKRLDGFLVVAFHHGVVLLERVELGTVVVELGLVRLGVVLVQLRDVVVSSGLCSNRSVILGLILGVGFQRSLGVVCDFDQAILLIHAGLQIVANPVVLVDVIFLCCAVDIHLSSFCVCVFIRSGSVLGR